MPELDGDDALREIHAIYPVPCIVVSAFRDLEQGGLDERPSTWAFLSKPFRQNDLRDAISRLMS